MSRIAILGCGYVGLELARKLTPTHEVVGVRRSTDGIEAIERTGVDAVQADITCRDELERVPDADVLVFAASSGGRDAEAARDIYVDGLQTVIETFGARTDSPERLVYTSTTGVYGDHDGDWVDEDTPVEPTTEKTGVFAEAERIALEEAHDYGMDSTVARFTGLYGPERYRLERYLDGPVTAGYLNMVHREDAAGAIRFLLDADAARGECVLVVDDEPVEKHAFADWLADECGVSRPEKQTKTERLAAGDLTEPAKRRIETAKRCSNDKLRGLGYEFTYPTYREGYQAAIETF